MAIYVIVRSRLGRPTALLAALGVAVSPYLITYSGLARGFMLADLALLVALGALLALAERETRTRWAMFIAAGAVAVWTEYGSAIFIVALVLTALWLGRPRRQATMLAGAVILMTLVPWIPQIIHGQNQVGITKFNPQSATPSLIALRDLFVTLAFGENGGTTRPTGRWLLFAGMLLAVCAGAVVLRRGWEQREPRARLTIQLLAGTAVLTIVGYALVALVGIDVFTERYLTILVPLGAALGAAAPLALDKRTVTIAAAVLLIGLGLIEAARRYRGEWEPNLAPVRAAAATIHPKTVLTNTPVVLYYLPSFAPVLDRPYNIGPGRARTCARPCLVIDDTRVPGGTARPTAPGTQSLIGPYLLTFER